MKCPHCGQDHPDNFQFCPVTGQRLVPQFKACSNDQCLDYGKYILPLDSKFCPSCGSPLGGSVDETDNTNKTDGMLEFNVDGVSFNMILVEHGSFMMGATEEQEAPYDDEKPVHKVILTRDYYIGETQVTQALWTAIMGNNPSHFSGDDRPVESVSWDDCQRFVGALNRKLRTELAGKKFRLPTEAEWEFAARGGNKSDGYQYAGSNDLCEVAWWGKNSGGETHPVAELKPNELGIYDMSGNVWEWCQDCYDDYPHNTQTNPVGPNDGARRVSRGGSWFNGAGGCRLSCRNYFTPDDCDESMGLRLVLSE